MAQIKVQGMGCGGCVGTITRAVRSVAPAAQVRVDLQTGIVQVDGDVDVTKAKQAIAAAGYKPE